MRKKPTQARAAATVDALVEAAAQIAARDGEATLTTAAVAARAGVSIGSLYQYFPNREALLAAVIHRERIAIADEIMREIRSAEPERLEETTRRIMRALAMAAERRRGKPDLLQFMAAIGPTVDESGVAVRHKVTALLMEVVNRHGASAAALSPASVYVLTRAVLGVFVAAAAEDSDHLGTPGFEDALVRLAHAFLRAPDGAFPS